jgi:hypothetical protein
LTPKTLLTLTIEHVRCCTQPTFADDTKPFSGFVLNQQYVGLPTNYPRSRFEMARKREAILGEAAQHLIITLNANGVVAPPLRAIEQTIEVVTFCLSVMEQSDLSEPPKLEAARFQMKFHRELSAEARKAAYTNWLLSKGFQDLARGIRQMLEEAFLFNSMVAIARANLSKAWTREELEPVTQNIRKRASNMKFPDLMTKVNKGLTAPLHFEREFLSLQKVRNCLEHRDGVVMEKDVNPETRVLRLGLPRAKIFYRDGGREIELRKETVVEKDTAVYFKNVIEERDFELGDRIIFKAEEFHDIGYGCWIFTNDLGSKLPQLKDSARDDYVEKHERRGSPARRK